MLNLLFVESSLELVPRKIARHPSVTRNAQREGKNPEGVLLDRSLHHHAMLNLPEAEKRGRPDIIHFCLLEALGSPLNKSGKLKLLVHTLNSDLLEVSPELRLPRDCYRFRSLIEQLFAVKRVPPEGTPLITFSRKSLSDVKADVHPSRTVALTSHGRARKLNNLCMDLAAETNPLVLIGAYPNGPMREETLKEADEAVSIYPESLEAWVVTSRLIYEYEKATGLE
jgi:rRNA small subunit pseudouridine methyltransferase Nep1